MAGSLDRGSFICDLGHELRVTCRCLRDDLGIEPPAAFADLVDVEIVKALISKRAEHVGEGKTVGPRAGGATLYRLGRGDDHRGATWADLPNSVVWLCAYGFHRSGTEDDAFKKFRRLMEAGQMYPTVEDYEWLNEDRDR